MARTHLIVPIIIVLLSGLALTATLLQSDGAQAQSSANVYKPSLGDIMGATQLRHFKLWFAGKLQNWDLARYELEQIKASFSDAATLYPGIPIADMSIMSDPGRRLDQAIEAKDSAKFAKAFEDMTAGCNACHQAIGRGFIAIRLPTSSPFSNQDFAPEKKR